MCKRELFDAKGDAISRQDIEDVIKSLSRYHGIYRITESISRVVKRRGGKYIPRLPVREGATRQEEVEVEEEEGEDIGYYGGEFWGNEEEMEFGEDAGDEYMEVDEGYEDGDEEWVEDDDGDDECDDDEGQEYKDKGMTGYET